MDLKPLLSQYTVQVTIVEIIDIRVLLCKIDINL